MTEIRVAIRNESGDGGLFLTPVWFGTHDGTFNLFDDGSAASAGLESLAEDGEIAAIGAEFTAAEPDGVAGAIFGSDGVPGVIDPGETASATVSIDPETNRFIDFASMVIPSNDAFIGTADAIELFDSDGNFLGERTIVIGGADVRDAGTEVNTEEDAAFLNQAGPNQGLTEGGVVGIHPGFIGSEGLPGDGGNIFGGTTAAGTIVDKEAADFTQAGFTLATVHVNIAVETAGTEGRDVIRGSDADDLVQGFGGRDVILTGAGWDVVDAGDGDDIVRTGTGDDIVAGGRGNDKISTGDGFDLILFNEGDGRDQVIDFDLEFDLIGLAVDGISGFGDLDGLIEARGNGRTVIDFGDGDAIVLLGVDADALTEDHFVFA